MKNVLENIKNYFKRNSIAKQPASARSSSSLLDDGFMEPDEDVMLAQSDPLPTDHVQQEYMHLASSPLPKTDYGVMMSFKDVLRNEHNLSDRDLKRFAFIYCEDIISLYQTRYSQQTREPQFTHKPLHRRLIDALPDEIIHHLKLFKGKGTKSHPVPCQAVQSTAAVPSRRTASPRVRSAGSCIVLSMTHHP